MWQALLTAAAAIAAVNWWAVGAGRRNIEAWTKPAVMVALIAAAASIPADNRWAQATIVVGLACGLAGDILLFRDKFVPGAAAFFAGHIAYLVAFIPAPHPATWVTLAALTAVVLGTVGAPAILRATRSEPAPLPVLVPLYMLVLGTMGFAAISTGVWAAAAGGLLFVISDIVLARNRFVRPNPQADLTVAVLYQVSQACFVVALLALPA